MENKLKNIQTFEQHTDKNSNDSNEHLLIVHFEGGDEIHFNVIDYSLYAQIEKMIDDGLNTTQKVEDMENIIYNNTLEDLMCQTYVLENYNQIGKYNIVKCIHLPELGS